MTLSDYIWNKIFYSSKLEFKLRIKTKNSIWVNGLYQLKKIIVHVEYFQ